MSFLAKITTTKECMYDDSNTERNNQSLFQLATILDINYVHFLQFHRDFIPQAELEEAFTYIIHKPIDFSYRLKTLYNTS